MTDPLLVAKNIGCAIRGRKILDGVSLALARGRLTAVIGPNGAGKSTLLRILAGDLTQATGSVRYGAEEAHLLAPWQLAARRAVMAQASRLSFPFSVREVAGLGLEGLGGRISRRARDKLIAAALETVGMSAQAARIYQTLSGGEQQRVQFARAITQLSGSENAIAEQILFLDEPTAHLDMAHQWRLMDAVRALSAQGAAVFMNMHDLNLAAAYADDVLVMKRGSLVGLGQPNDILNRALIAEVFDIDAEIGETPPPGARFVLPHAHAQKRRHA